MSDMYTLSELSQKTGISQAALSKRILRGKLAAQKDDKGHWVVAAEEAEKLRHGRRGRAASSTVSPASGESYSRSASRETEDRTMEPSSTGAVSAVASVGAVNAATSENLHARTTVTTAEINDLRNRLARKRAEIERLEATLAGLRESASLLEQLLAAKTELMNRRRRI
ncbi:hypothetical protein CS006_03755 [Bifidobacterium primatium]|uniref:Helix-turn-helix domain-containing protein n=1 Tax=Bifidobacterium primatium TaxID=2045438 RepID=A0A2M9HBP6_9BIFI|nr:hypothetical protein [Bifidobacterium primatium]PJM74242.1 hypothetical protein CS006_03755 [Bifidobacterium primatium]